MTGSPDIFLHPGGIMMEKMSADLTTRCSFWHNLSVEILTWCKILYHCGFGQLNPVLTMLIFSLHT